MAKSLSHIQSQIQKLQKEADAIRATVIARIRKEMAQHGLTAEDLFAEARSTFIGNGRRTKAKAAATKAPKYADGAGNTWGGMGKRPGWIREALEAGRALEEFLVGAIAKPAKATKATKPARKKAATAKKAPPARKPPAKKPGRAAATKKAAAKHPARKKASSSADTPAES
ncbi:H-NS family nucleoid-associated regulatory protein [Roseateles sp.]|uniref:H-NS histone family protein n=1 Tax=Roseateles sp. TaxID=1971397 RepID=UPI0039EC27B7